MAIWRKWQKRKAAGWLLSMLCVFMATSGMAANDLMLLPAIKSKLVTSSMLMDVTKAGNRLVAVGERGHIIFSDDQGKSWTQADVPVSVTLTAVAFPTPESGWAVGHDSVVLHSIDAGRSWRIQVEAKVLRALMVSAVKRLVERQRCVLEQAPEHLREELELKQEDVEFFLNDVSAAVVEETAYPFMDLWFDNAKEGLLFGAFGMIFRTGDGGKTWSAIADKVEVVKGFHYYAVGETADGGLLAVGEAGTLLHSQDRGRTWRERKSPYPGSLFGIVTSSRSSCAVGVGLRGNAVRVCGKGVAAAALPSFGEELLSGGTVLSDGTLVVVGMAPVLHVSTNNGKTFRKVSTPFPGCMAVEQAGDGTLLLVGLGGVYKMTLPEID